MMTIGKDRWDAALSRLRFALLGDPSGEGGAARVLERSRERVQAARDALERAQQPPRPRPYRRRGA